VVWRKVWGEIRRPASEGQRLEASARATAKRLSTPAPARFGKTGARPKRSIRIMRSNRKSSFALTLYHKASCPVAGFLNSA
jgi:hypothetical protein